jgi:hypothetical protein
MTDGWFRNSELFQERIKLVPIVGLSLTSAIQLFENNLNASEYERRQLA